MHALRHAIAIAIAVTALSGAAALSGCATSASGTTGTTASGVVGAGSSSQAVTVTPVHASTPPSATAKPAATKKPATAPTASASAGQRATGAGSNSSGTGSGSGGTGSGAGGTGSGSGGSGSGSGSAAGSGTCQHPVFTTSASQGGETLDGYDVTNDIVNVGGSSVSQTLHVCSPASWNVAATINSGNADVESYPNAHKDFGLAISSLHSVTSSFAQATNPNGIYEYAYDIWINGVATSTSAQVMIWTSTSGRVPEGFEEGSARFGGQNFIVWRSGDYITFVATQNLNSGSLNLLQFLDYIIGQGWLTSSDTLSQVGYGVQLASTNNAPETFAVTNFSVSTS